MELFRLLGRIAIDNSTANKAIDETTDKAAKSEGKLSKSFEKMGSFALKAGKVIATGLAVGVTAIAGLTTAALNSYADYEQLVGGVETLFKESGQKVQEYADEAYKTAGMSANEYMETVTSFSASLIQSLGGDTKQAAEKANQAIIDMSDNANKMGSSMESIQNAYQGFAKQNYTMLDNLKLGYGGTKEEMARLLADAQAISGIKYDISSYADVVDAIHVIQEEMGIAGTTAKEASSTISGSISSMKSAWQNLVAGFGNEDADLSQLIDNFVDSAMIAANNVIPRIQVILEGIAQAVKTIIPKIAEFLPSLIETLLPPLIEGATNLFVGLATALPSIVRILIKQIPFIVTQIAQAVTEAFPVLLNTITGLFAEIWDFISLELLNTGVSFQEGCTVIQNVFVGLWDVLQTVWYAIGQPIWDMISYAVMSVAGLFSENMPAIQEFAQTAMEGIKDTWENHLKPAFEAIGNFLNDVLKPIFEFVFSVFILPMIQNVFSRIGSLWTNTLKPIFDGMCDFLTGVFTLDFEKAFNGLLKIVTSIFNSITDTINSSIELAKDIVGKGVEKLCDLFDFDWELPKIKLPHFSISGSFSINPPSVPSFGIEWYKNGGVMMKPTAFGINPANGKMMVGGEAGAEAIAPISTLQRYIQEAVGENDMYIVEAINEGFNQLINLLLQYIPQLSNMQLVMDTGVVVGELAPQMDVELGKLAIKNKRGV